MYYTPEFAQQLFELLHLHRNGCERMYGRIVYVHERVCVCLCVCTVLYLCVFSWMGESQWPVSDDLSEVFKEKRPRRHFSSLSLFVLQLFQSGSLRPAASAFLGRLQCGHAN